MSNILLDRLEWIWVKEGTMVVDAVRTGAGVPARVWILAFAIVRYLTRRTRKDTTVIVHVPCPAMSEHEIISFFLNNHVERGAIRKLQL